ncbi:MAG: cytidine deaminase [bacterium]
MQKRVIEVAVGVYDYNELSERDKQLVDAAKETTTRSYAPYSRFNVAAAIMLDNGEIVVGTNQENSAYPSGLCAERVAMFYANSKYPEASPIALAIATFAQGEFLAEPITPCGACRQVLLESEDRYGKPIEVLMYGTNHIYQIASVKDLLPLCFDKSSLK